MAHVVDGFELRFTSRRSWKAERREHGRLLDIIPVTWTKGRTVDGATNDIFLRVWYQSDAELAAVAASRNPIVVAMAIAKDYSKEPHEFEEFRAVFEVQPTGRVFDEKSLETKILRRLRAQ